MGVNMKSFLNILFAAIAFSFCILIAYLTKNEIVLNAVILAFLIQWVAFIPAYLFQTEKFYDLTGSLTYLTVIWFVYLSSNQVGEVNFQNLIVTVLISIWAIRLGTFLFSRIHKDGEDKRFRSIKTSPSQFFMTWTLQGMWVSICSMCAILCLSSEMKMNYTMTGDKVNLTARLESSAKQFGIVIQVSDTIYKENKDKFIFRDLGKVVVVGRNQHFK
jgi:steroid 5-alpha reductase family enzyme